MHKRKDATPMEPIYVVTQSEQYYPSPADGDWKAVFTDRQTALDFAKTLTHSQTMVSVIKISDLRDDENDSLDHDTIYDQYNSRL